MILLRWLTFLLGSLTVTQTVLLFWIYFFLVALVSVLQWLFLHWEALIMLLSVSIDFPINWKQDTPFHHIVYDFSCADWDGFCDNLRDVQMFSHKNMLLMLTFLKGPFLVLHYSYYKLMTFLMLLSVILLYLLIILLSTLNLIRHLICGNNQNWFLNLNLIYETLWTGAGSGLLISMLKKTHLVSFDQSVDTGAIYMEVDGSVLEEKSF